MKEPKIVSKGEIPIAYIEINVTLKEWGKANALFPRISEWIDKNSGTQAGPPFYQYIVIGDFEKEYHLRAGVITQSLMQGDEEVKTDYLAPGNYLSYIHEGHPDQLDNSHEYIRNWVKEKNITLAKTETPEGAIWDGLYEFYLTDPEEEPDLNKWKTEILYLLR